MKIAILSRGYPTSQKKYNYAFVHRRAIQYTKKEHKVRVFTLSNSISIDYRYEEIPVSVRTHGGILSEISDYCPDVIFAHAPTTGLLAEGLLDELSMIQSHTDLPIIYFIHGQEALLRMLYYPSSIGLCLDSNSHSAVKELGREAFHNVKNVNRLIQIRANIKRLDQNRNHIVFVSEWLEKAVKNSIRYDVKNTSVIPNPVDDELFSYTERDRKNINKILSIRPLSRKKYANDLSIKAIAKVENAQLDLYGEGRFLDYYIKMSQDLNASVDFHPQFLHQQEIPKLHDQYGIYLTPSRADSQGVSMCEAMASGLPVITTPVGGIPEFVTDGKTGFLCSSTEEMANKIKYLQDNPDELIALGENAASSIRDVCSAELVCKRDLQLARNLIAK